MNIYENLTELIGNTPMVYLNRFGNGLEAKLAAKLEMFNPYSVKDRPIREMIEAGLLYMNWVWDRFPDHLESAEHMWFTLAGYNAGHGHVRDARRLARQLDLDADLWFGNVEIAMLKLSQAKYAQQARHGFVRGREPVGYVRGIRERYRAYVDLLDSETAERD